ncbi:23391_t:CDS:2 [Cetraspora pellucida]|uniref:23391_t:CDS:1 n=1 Tax=Cetraspora pellucida TaxID=1433469 RepID=A0A9N9BZU4_9GLOM|nr:23391_t:CDS:2 [Cetraspora pellucida]
MGYADFESLGSQSHPNYKEESQQFRIQLRKAGFLDPNKNCDFGSLDKNNKLNKFSLTKSSELTCSISIILDKVQLQLTDSSLKKKVIVFIIKILVGFLNKAKWSQFK